jgi:hypothetical protein
MLDNESEEQVGQPNPEELVKKVLVDHPEVLEDVEERKLRKFTWSGLVLIVIGVVLVAVVIGVLRILIGLIKPIAPSQL